MTDQTEDNDDNLTNGVPQDDEGKGKSGSGKGSTGKGKAGSGDGGIGSGITLARFSAKGLRLPPAKLKGVHNDWEYLDVVKAMARLAEFFGEGIARASANLQVSFANISQKGFAVISQAISFGQEVSQLLRDRTAGNIKRLRTKYGIKMPRAAPAPGSTPGMS